MRLETKLDFAWFKRWCISLRITEFFFYLSTFRYFLKKGHEVSVTAYVSVFRWGADACSFHSLRNGYPQSLDNSCHYSYLNTSTWDQALSKDDDRKIYNKHVDKSCIDLKLRYTGRYLNIKYNRPEHAKKFNSRSSQ